jgi:hypothetical protein
MNKEERQEALNELYKNTEELYDSYENKEEFFASQHWANNPLISPVSKMVMAKEREQEAFQAGRKFERNRIRERLQEEIDLNRKEIDLIDEKMKSKNVDEDSMLEEDRLAIFLYMSGLNGAKMITKWVEYDQTESGDSLA